MPGEAGAFHAGGVFADAGENGQFTQRFYFVFFQFFRAGNHFGQHTNDSGDWLGNSAGFAIGQFKLEPGHTG